MAVVSRKVSLYMCTTINVYIVQFCLSESLCDPKPSSGQSSKKYLNLSFHDVTMLNVYIWKKPV